MPLTDPNSWQLIAKWLAGISATVLGMYGAAVKWWVKDRFKKIDDRLVTVEADVKKQAEKSAEHDTALVRLETHMKHSQDDRKEIHTKLDNIHNLLIKNATRN